ncbi:MAG TPA: biotin/lipoyl-containing protein, partial [Acidimicrobiales bacterium]|nr:biotin/lipoyl-containing protein [Acidimicrobiales bacterium]
MTMPQLGETVTEGTITKWYKGVGDQVARDEPLFEVSTDKVDSEVPSPAEGVLTAILVEEGDTVDVGATLAVIGDSTGSNGTAPPGADAGAGIGDDAGAVESGGLVDAPSPDRPEGGTDIVAPARSDVVETD